MDCNIFGKILTGSESMLSVTEQGQKLNTMEDKDV